MQCQTYGCLPPLHSWVGACPITRHLDISRGHLIGIVAEGGASASFANRSKCSRERRQAYRLITLSGCCKGERDVDMGKEEGSSGVAGVWIH